MHVPSTPGREDRPGGLHRPRCRQGKVQAFDDPVLRNPGKPGPGAGCTHGNTQQAVADTRTAGSVRAALVAPLVMKKGPFDAGRLWQGRSCQTGVSRGGWGLKERWSPPEVGRPMLWALPPSLGPQPAWALSSLPLRPRHLEEGEDGAHAGRGLLRTPAPAARLAPRNQMLCARELEASWGDGAGCGGGS